MTKLNELVSGQGFIMVNKGLAQIVGLIPSTIYGELLSTYNYWKNENKLTMIDGKEWFFCTIEDLEDKTTVKKDVQSKAIKKLEREGLLETKRYGLPAKRYFHITDKFNRMLINEYILEAEKEVKSDDLASKNSHESRPNQISQIPQTAFLDSRKLDYSNTATNNKQINNKQIIKKDSLSNELSIVNWQVTDDKSSYSVLEESEPMQFEHIEGPPTIDVSQIKKQVEQQLKADQTLSDETEAIQLLTNAANEYYIEFSSGRWNKKQWTNLITKFVSETIINKRYLNVTYGKVKGYVYTALKKIAEHHDYKNSKEFGEYKQAMNEMLASNKNTEVELPSDLYNWLEERD